MKLAEALLLRSDLEKKLASLRERVEKYVIVQQGDKPHEDPNMLLKESFGVLGQLEGMVRQINETNLSATLSDGRCLTAALARRDVLKQKHAILTQAINGASKEPERYGLSEIKWVSVVKVSALQKHADDVSRDLRELNVQLQEANWRVEVVEVGTSKRKR